MKSKHTAQSEPNQPTPLLEREEPSEFNQQECTLCGGSGLIPYPSTPLLGQDEPARETREDLWKRAWTDGYIAASSVDKPRDIPAYVEKKGLWDGYTQRPDALNEAQQNSKYWHDAYEVVFKQCTESQSALTQALTSLAAARGEIINLVGDMNNYHRRAELAESQLSAAKQTIETLRENTR